MPGVISLHMAMEYEVNREGNQKEVNDAQNDFYRHR
jgi:hypothetical protein